MSEKSALRGETQALTDSDAARIAALEAEIAGDQDECRAELALLHEAIRKLGRRLSTLEEMP